MLFKSKGFRVGALAAGISALSSLSCAVAESITPEAAPSQQGPAKIRLTKGELDAVFKRLLSYWNPPAVKNPEEIIVRVRINLKTDGTLAGPPEVVTTGTSKEYLAARDSAVRAIFASQPFDMFLPAHYDAWKHIEINFDPRNVGKR